MRNEDIEGRLQNLEVSINAILLRLKWIEDELHPKRETVVAPLSLVETNISTPTAVDENPAVPTVASAPHDPTIHSGPPPIISEPIVANERELIKPKIPDYMWQNREEEAKAAASAPPPAQPSTPSPFDRPKAPPCRTKNYPASAANR